MPISHVNRSEDTYYLHSGVTKTGKPRYWFSRSSEGELAESIPDGYEVYESPTNQVFLRKIPLQVILPLEVAVVEAGLRQYAPGQNCLIDLDKADIVIYHAERINLDREFARLLGNREYPARFDRYVKVMRFTLIDPKTRRFQVQRWCFRGSVDHWIDLVMSYKVDRLIDLVKKFAPHLGQESFFELY